MKAGGRLLPALAGLLAALIWGVWFPVTRIGVVDGAITPADMMLLRGLAGALVLSPIVLRRGLKAGAAGWGGTAAILLTMSGPFAFAMGMGVAHAPAAHAAIFTPGFYPALVFLLALVVFRDPGALRRWGGFAAMLAGVALVGWAAAENGLGGLSGYLWFHACAWFWAIYTIVVRLSALPAIHALAITHVGAMLVYGPIWLILGDTGLFDLSLGALAFQVGYHSVLNGIVAMFLYTFAVQRLGAAEGAVFAALVPCVAAFSAWPLLGEAVGWREGAALLFVGLGVWLISAAPRRAG